MNSPSSILISIVLTGLLLSGCGDDDEPVTSSDNGAPVEEVDEVDCSANDVDCGGPNRCGDHLVTASENDDLELALLDPHRSTVHDVVTEQDAEVFEVSIEVTNTTDELVGIDDRPNLRLADRETLTVVSTGGPGLHYTAVRPPLEIPAGDSVRLDPTVTRTYGHHLDVGVEDAYTCDGDDLPPGEYVLLAEVRQRDILDPDPERRRNQEYNEYTYYATIDVEIP